MKAHVIKIDIERYREPYPGKPLGLDRYRWVCSCKKRGPWKNGTEVHGSHVRASRSARTGGQRHVAAMERGR